jgi:small subunit ribosomal protein S15
MMNGKKKKVIMGKYGTHSNDTGSSVVQVAILTQRIIELSDHLKNHPKDKDSRRGLLGLVAKRRRHLNYLKLNNNEAYTKLTEELTLKAS